MMAISSIHLLLICFEDAGTNGLHYGNHIKTATKIVSSATVYNTEQFLPICLENRPLTHCNRLSAARKNLSVQLTYRNRITLLPRVGCPVHIDSVTKNIGDDYRCKKYILPLVDTPGLFAWMIRRVIKIDYIQ